ncbi:hypothetical protein C8R47DRAFT_1316759 [Mycena vitilis]|nr:hypothetical protein C8R47DRAFT_1316759 [Mycena vitilis]
MSRTPPSDVVPTTSSILGHPGAVSSGMFSGAQNFTVTGHTFQNNIYAAPAVPPDYRRFPLGDLDLQREICLTQSTGVVHRRRRVERRVYTAILQCQTVTVAMYSGDGAAEEWRQEVETYIHPNIIQIYGSASWGNMHAIVFHGDLILFTDFMATYYVDFPCLAVYLRSYGRQQFQVTTLILLVTISTAPQAAADYLGPRIQQELTMWNCTMWIHHSTGRLCVDLMRPAHAVVILDLTSRITVSEPEAKALFTGNANDIEALIIDTLTPKAYHQLCRWSFGTCITGYTPVPITGHLGMVVSSSTIMNDPFVRDRSVEIASLPDACLEISSWKISSWNRPGVWDEPVEDSGEMQSKVMENGWTRFNTGDALGSSVRLTHNFSLSEHATVSWLSQANHIFQRSQIVSDLQNYVLVCVVSFEVTVSSIENDPEGFLFLCPTDDFDVTSGGWPARPTYWSLDPSGMHALSTEDATKAGFPELQFKISTYGKSWYPSEYAGLCKFHQAKGFDPYSQDVARHLGLPLYQLSGYVDHPFAHVIAEEDESDSHDHDDPDSQMDVDADSAEDPENECLSDMDID